MGINVNRRSAGFSCRAGDWNLGEVGAPLCRLVKFSPFLRFRVHNRSGKVPLLEMVPVQILPR
jgi:hypothetical protein